MVTELLTALGGLPLWLATVILVGGAFLTAMVIEFVGLRLVRRLVRRTESDVDDIVLDEFRLPIVVTVALTGIWLITQFPETGSVISQDALDAFFGQPSLTVIVLVWARALNNVVNRVVEAVGTDGSRFDFAPVLSNVWTLVVFVGAAGIVLRIWNVEITPLLGAAGIAGIAIGFAAKDTVANFFGGIALYFDDTYKLGDFIQIDSGETGTVVKVGIRSTTLLTRSEELITVPNSVLNAARIVNRSAPQRRKRITVSIGVGYGTDIDAFEELLVDIALEENLILDSPKPRARFRRFGDSALEYELLAWVRSPVREAKARHELNRTIYKRLGDEGIEIPFPKRDVAVAWTGDVPGAPGATTAATPSSAGETAATPSPNGETATTETGTVEDRSSPNPGPADAAGSDSPASE